MTLTADEAAFVPAPRIGVPNAVAVTDAGITSQDTGVTQGRQWHTFAADGDNVYITFSGDTGDTLPDPTSVSGNAVAWVVFANTTQDYMIAKDSRYFRAATKTGETATLRWRKSG